MSCVSFYAHNPMPSMHSESVCLHFMLTDLAFLGWTRAPECRFVVDKRLAGYYTVQFMESGSVRLAYDGQSQVLKGSWFWPAYPGPNIYFAPAEPNGHWFHRHVGFHGALVGRWIAEGIWPAGPQPVEASDFGERFDALIELVRRGDPWAARRAAHRLEGMLLDLAEARAGSSLTEPWLAEVLGALGEREECVPDFVSLSQKVGMASSTLRRRFRAAMGVSMHEHVIASRIVHAKALLMETDLTLEAVANLLNYPSPAFFSRQFKHLTGISPAQFRRSRT